MENEIDILELNEKIYQFLKNKRLSDKNLRYTFRKSNYGGRLDDGYWFYGNDTYLAISFWSGMDWKNRTPNIIVRFTTSGEIRLEVNVSDSDRKRDFIQQYIVDQLDMQIEGRRFIRVLRENCNLEQSIDELDVFLSGLKFDIDEIIKVKGKQYFLKNENSIDFIDSLEFSSRQRNVNKYQDKLREESDDYISSNLKPNKINSFKILDYGPINRIEVNDIPFNNQWIFITGENGSGKTNFLRAIATALGYRTIKKEKLTRHPNFKIETRLYTSNSSNIESFDRIDNNDTSHRRPKISGLCMYGPYRLMNSHNLTTAQFKSLYKKSGSFQSLFSDIAPLLDLEKQFDIWSINIKSRSFFEKRMYYIQSILADIVPGLYDIRFESGLTSRKNKTRYITRKNIDESEEGVQWSELSSGTKSVFSLLVDIMLRLYEQQPKIVDPSELTGVVLIDEIDLHLHPKAQRELIINLSKVFRKVQFIVTTHSPIPLLGAPINSRIYVMNLIGEKIEFTRMDDKVLFNKILPNAIFSSPIFNFDNLTPNSLRVGDVPYADEDFNRVMTLENLDSEVNDFLSNKSQKELSDLFTKKSENEGD